MDSKCPENKPLSLYVSDAPDDDGMIAFVAEHECGGNTYTAGTTVSRNLAEDKTAVADLVKRELIDEVKAKAHPDEVA